MCKLVQERGCEKSGRMVDFATFLKTERGLDHVPLAPFFGNRFNILFYNAAGTYFLEDHLKVFFERVRNENKLLSAVYYDLEVPSFMAACRALGMIDKLITGPLWRCIADEGHILDMSSQYQRLYDCFLLWSADASQFINGEVNIFGNEVKVHKDEVFEYLFLSGSEEFDELTKQCLELIFNGFLSVTKRLLKDHLKEEDGMLWEKQSNEEFREETKSMKKTNVCEERDFGMLDYQMKLKPKATDFAIEGLIMFKANNTARWIRELSEETRNLLMDVARKSKKIQNEKYIQTKSKILNERAKKNAEKLEEKKKKEKSQRILKESLHNEIEKVGLWKTEEEVRNNLKEISGNNKKIEGLWLQIRFRSKVIGNTHNDKKVVQLTSGGKAFSVEQMMQNLLKIIKTANEDRDGIQRDDEPFVDSSKVLVLDKERFLIEKDKLFLKASNPTKYKASNPTKRKESKKRKKNVPAETGKKRKLNKEAEIHVPVVSCAEDLIGKRICHRFENENGEERWYYGSVLSGGPGSNPYFKIFYDDSDEIVKYRLMEDWKNNDLRLVPLTEDDLCDTTILHLYSDEISEKDCWYKAKVEGIDVESDDMENPDFLFVIITMIMRLIVSITCASFMRITQWMGANNFLIW